MSNHACWVGVLALALGFLSGCGTIPDRAQDLPYLADAKDFPPSGASLGSFRLQPGDEIEIRFINHPEFNDTIMIRPDGKISILFAEEVVVAGKTVEAVDRELTEKLSEQLKEPELTVILQSAKSHVVFVGGEVKSPGEKPIHGRLTLTEAVLLAGGYVRDTANVEEVVLLRRGEDGFRHACKVNLEDLLVASQALDEVYLEPLDIVIVPPKGVIDYNDFVDRYINRNLPGRGLFGVSFVPN